MREGLYAIKWPDAETAYNLLFSPTRGLFFWTPFLAMAGAGYAVLVRTIQNRKAQSLFWLTYAVPLLQVVIISGRVWDWQAGPTLGPRYLAPILPLMALPCALGVARFPKIGAVLALASVALTTLATLVNAAPSRHIYVQPGERQLRYLRLLGVCLPRAGDCQPYLSLRNFAVFVLPPPRL